MSLPCLSPNVSGEVVKAALRQLASRTAEDDLPLTIAEAISSADVRLHSREVKPAAAGQSIDVHDRTAFPAGTHRLEVIVLVGFVVGGIGDRGDRGPGGRGRGSVAGGGRWSSSSRRLAASTRR